jgi:phospholipid/cholesterol/gamma-HCH transport system permease protein
LLGLWRAWAQRGWQVLLASVMLLVLAVSPRVYSPAHRAAVARRVMQATWPHVLWFSLGATLLGVVLIRIVVVTAQSYGLSQYALEMVVRVLVLELLPLMAALFVALRWSLPATAQLARTLRKASQGGQGGQVGEVASKGPVPDAVTWLAQEALPRALAGVFAVWLLAAVSCVLGLVMAYLLVYGWTPWGLDAYTHMVGRVFSPAVTLIFVLKTCAFSVAVAVVPVAGLSAPVVWRNPDALRALEMQGLVRMTGLLLLVEVVSLMGNYY